MKDKILFWIDDDFIHFGIAKFLQNKYDCELFSILDLDEKPTKFFREQQLVKFEKLWYYDEHPPTEDEKPDIQYLISFEKKYKINLWRIAYLDRHFSLPDPFYKITKNQILILLERACRFSENVLDELRPDFYITKMTNMHHNHLFYELCKSRKIPVLMLIPDRFGGRCMISQEAHKIDDIEEQPRELSPTKTIEELQQYMNKFSASERMERITTNFQAYEKNKILAWISGFLLSTDNKSFTNNFTHYGQTKSKVLMNAIKNVVRKRLREGFINKNFIREINDDLPFVYYPLHYEPERLYLVDFPFYDDQRYVIRNIARSLPMGYQLYVKEHPAMGLLCWRDVSYYKEIMDLPNVKLIHPSVKSEDLIKKCSLVITIAGTTGLEAAFHLKPSILFSDVIYSSLPFIFKLEKIEDLPGAIRASLQKEVNSMDLNQYVNMIDRNSFDLDLAGLQTDFGNKFYRGVLSDVEIPVPQMQSFLEEHQTIFEKLASEHIQKIKKYKEAAQKNVKQI